MEQEQHSPLVMLAKALEQFPKYAVGFIVGLMVAMVSDYTITMLTIGAVLLGFITSILIASAAFTFAYVLIRTVNTVANAIGITGERMIMARNQFPPHV